MIVNRAENRVRASVHVVEAIDWANKSPLHPEQLPD